MRRRNFFLIFSLIFLLALYFSIPEVNAQTKNKKTGKAFVDLNGDGVCDRFQAGYGFDDDGDGIPNGQDPDYVKPQDGTGKQFKRGNAYHSKLGKGGFGPGDGTGNSGLGPRDGTGYGAGSGTGICDGTGPKGKRSLNSGKK
jgi:hypothetical protein